MPDDGMIEEVLPVGRYRKLTGLEWIQINGSAQHPLGLQCVCEDCGVLVVDEKAHNRSHAIGNDVARTLAILQVAHIGANVHDRYDAYDKIVKGRNRNNWSQEAFDEVVADLFTWCEDADCPDQAEGRHVH